MSVGVAVSVGVSLGIGESVTEGWGVSVSGRVSAIDPGSAVVEQAASRMARMRMKEMFFTVRVINQCLFYMLSAASFQQTPYFTV